MTGSPIARKNTTQKLIGYRTFIYASDLPPHRALTHLMIFSCGEPWVNIRLALPTCDASLFLYTYPNHKIINIYNNDYKYTFGYARDPVPKGPPKYIGADNFLLNFLSFYQINVRNF